MTPSTPLEERFWKKVDKKSINECWEWMAYIHPSGYGTIGRGYKNPKMLLAHRVSWTLHFGEIPKGMLVCHRCDNRSCVNPNHLFLGTHKDNTQDMVKKGRYGYNNVKGEKHGRSKLTVDDVLKIRHIWNTCVPRPTQKNLASKFGVARPTINSIVNNMIWKHI